MMIDDCWWLLMIGDDLWVPPTNHTSNHSHHSGSIPRTRHVPPDAATTLYSTPLHIHIHITILGLLLTIYSALLRSIKKNPFVLQRHNVVPRQLCFAATHRYPISTIGYCTWYHSTMRCHSRGEASQCHMLDDDWWWVMMIVGDWWWLVSSTH